MSELSDEQVAIARDSWLANHSCETMQCPPRIAQTHRIERATRQAFGVLLIKNATYRDALTRIARENTNTRAGEIARRALDA